MPRARKYSQELLDRGAKAADYRILSDHVGIMGFSAGGYVAAGTATEYNAESRPSFTAPIYALWEERPVPADAPPLFVVTASDDWTTRIWDVESRAEVLALPGGAVAAFSPDGTRIITRGLDPNTVIVYDSRPVNRAFLRIEVL